MRWEDEREKEEFFKFICCWNRLKYKKHFYIRHRFHRKQSPKL